MIFTGMRLVENHVSTDSRGQEKIIVNDTLNNKHSLSHCTFPASSFRLPFVLQLRPRRWCSQSRTLPTTLPVKRPSLCQQPTTFVGVQACGPTSVLVPLLTDALYHRLNVKIQVRKRRKTHLKEPGAVEGAQTRWRATGQSRHP